MATPTPLAVRKSNNLIEVGENISKPAKLFVLFLIAQMPPDQTEFKRLNITYDQLKKVVNIDGKKRISTIAEAERMMDELGKNLLKFENEEFRDTVTWFTKMRYYKKKRMWQFLFHGELQRHLLQLKEKFTMYSFWYTVCLSPHAIKIYELMKRYEYLGTCEIPVAKQKYFLGIENKYAEYYEYRRNVLDEAKKELELYTDVKFTYEPSEKKGRSIVAHRFFIEKNTPRLLPDPLKKISKQQELPFHYDNKDRLAKPVTTKDLDREVVKTLQKWGGKTRSINTLLKQYGEKKLLYQYQHTQHALEAGKVSTNPFGWLVSALKGGYQDPLQEERKKQIKEKVKIEIQSNKLERLQKELTAIRRERYKASKVICDIIVQEYPDILESIVEEHRGGLVLAKHVRAGKKAEELYDYKFTTGFMRSQIEARFPERFEFLSSSFDIKIQELEKEVEQFG